MKYCIEIAVTDYTTARAAAAGGADRIELCSALSEGGITPSHALIKQCRQDITLPLFPIIRPRAGDFLYSEEEFRIIQQDILTCKRLGCDGIVTGILNRDGTVDRKKTALLRELAYPMEMTFHRAFDRTRDPYEAMEELIQIGCDRILTSGQQATAPEAIPLLGALIKTAGDSIIIMPGSGVRPANINQLAAQTGASDFHASLRRTAPSRMAYLHPAFAHTDDYTLAAVEEEEVRELRRALYSSPGSITPPMEPDNQ